MAKLVDAPDLGSGGVTRGGSSPSSRTKFILTDISMSDVIHLNSPHNILLAAISVQLRNGEPVAIASGTITLKDAPIPIGETAEQFIWENCYANSYSTSEDGNTIIKAFGFRIIDDLKSDNPEWQADHPDNQFFVLPNPKMQMLTSWETPILPQDENFLASALCNPIMPDIFIAPDTAIHALAITGIDFTGFGINMIFPVYPGQRLLSGLTGEHGCTVRRKGEFDVLGTTGHLFTITRSPEFSL